MYSGSTRSSSSRSWCAAGGASPEVKYATSRRSPAACLPDDDGRVPHPGVRAQGGLHLAGLDAEAAHLDLRVRPPQELQRPVRAPPPPVARAVGAAPLARDEPARGELRPPQVAQRHAAPGNPDLAGDAHGHGLAPVVADPQPHPGERGADGVPLDRALRRQLPCGADDGGLGGAVEDADARRREGGPHLLQQVRRDPVAAGEQEPDAGEAAPLARRAHHLAHQRGDGVQHRGLARRLHQRLRVRHLLAAQLPARSRPRPGGREAPAGRCRTPPTPAPPPCRPGRAPAPPGGRQGVGELRVRHHHRLRRAGGAGGVDQVGEVVEGTGFIRCTRSVERHREQGTACNCRLVLLPVHRQRTSACSGSRWARPGSESASRAPESPRRKARRPAG